MLTFFEIPETVHPGLRKFIYGLIYVHLIAFAIYIFLIARSFFQKPEKEVKQFKEAQGKLE